MLLLAPNCAESTTKNWFDSTGTSTPFSIRVSNIRPASKPIPDNGISTVGTLSALTRKTAERSPD